MTDFGLECLNRVPWGTHVCHFYGSQSELIDVVIPYLVTGLKREECCIGVCSTRLEVEQVVKLLNERVPHLSSYLASGQLEIVSYDKWYLDSRGIFDAEKVLGRLRQKLDKALSEGWAGLRIAGNTSWVTQSLWKEFDSYETRLFGSIAQDPIVVLCLYPRQGEWVSQILDITESHQYALLKERSRWKIVECSRKWDTQWRSIVDSLFTGVLLVENCGSIIASNSSLLKMFGVNTLHDLGHNLSQFASRFSFCPDSENIYSELIDLLKDESGKSYVWSFKPYGDTSQVWVSVRVRELSSALWASRRFILVMEDVTDLKRPKDQLLHIMSHEFKNPLQAMKGAVKLLSCVQSGDDQSVKRYIEILDNQINHLSSLVEEALNTCRIRGKKMVIKKVETDLVEIINDWIESTRASSQRNIIPLFPTDMKIPVYIDPIRMREILSNILGNAVKYTSPGKRIWVKIQSLANHVVVKIKDEGIGIPPEEMDKVFEPFYRASNSKGVADGEGIGLYISRELARLHGGEMWIDRRPGMGTVVNLRLPLLTKKPDYKSVNISPTA